MRIYRLAAAIAVLTLLQACAAHEERRAYYAAVCAKEGYAPDSKEFRGCVRAKAPNTPAPAFRPVQRCFTSSGGTTCY